MFIIILAISISQYVAQGAKKANLLKLRLASSLDNVSRGISSKQKINLNYYQTKPSKQIKLQAARGEYKSFQIWSNDFWYISLVYQQGKKDFSSEDMLLDPVAKVEVGIKRVVPSIT